eukprot:scaffold112_cov196-Amphora_coffeaeformis.AAC.9
MSATTTITEDDILLRHDVSLFLGNESSMNDDDSSSSYYTVLTLNQPRQYNPLSLAMLERLQEELERADMAFPDCRAVVITSTPRSNDKNNNNDNKKVSAAFSAGHDMKEIHRYIHQKDNNNNNEREATVRHLFDTCATVMQSLSQIRPVTIAAVHGVAAAAGCQLVAASDWALATPSSRFALSGIHHGLVCSTPLVPVVRSAGMLPKRALQMLLTGDFLSAHQAAEYGLINTVVPDGDEALSQATHDLVVSMARHSAHATTRGKQLFYQLATTVPELSDAYALATNRIVEDIVHSVDAQTGIAAFCEKRPRPTWKSNCIATNGISIATVHVPRTANPQR